MTGAVALLPVIVGLWGQVSSDCGVPVLREGAADLVNASFKKGFHLTDFTKIEIQATPYNLVEDGACIDGDKMVLQYNNDGGEDWTVVDVKPKSIGGGDFKFTVGDIVPCKDHYFKIVLSGDNGNLVQGFPVRFPFLFFSPLS